MTRKPSLGYLRQRGDSVAKTEEFFYFVSPAQVASVTVQIWRGPFRVEVKTSATRAVVKDSHTKAVVAGA